MAAGVQEEGAGGNGGAPRRLGTPLSLRRAGRRAGPVGALAKSASPAAAAAVRRLGGRSRQQDARGGAGADRGAAEGAGVDGADVGASVDQEGASTGGAGVLAAVQEQIKQRSQQEAERKRCQQRAAQLRAAARERRLLLCLVLLRHVAYRDAAAKEVLVEAGLLRTIVQLWPVGVQRPAVMGELLSLMACLAPGSAAVRAAMVAPASPRMPAPLALLLQDLQSAGQQGEGVVGGAAVFSGATRALLHFGSSADGAAALAHPSCSFLAEGQKLLHGFLMSKDHQRAAAVLQLLAVVAAAPEGQRAMLRATAAPALLDLAVTALQAPHTGLVTAALLLLHNLSFHGDLKTPALANPKLLPLLLVAAESLQPEALLRQRQQLPNAHRCAGAARAAAAAAAAAAALGRPEPKQEFVLVGRGPGCKQGCCNPVSSAAAEAAAAAVASGGGCQLLIGGNAAAAAYAAAALWALMFRGEAVKAAVRKLPNAGERLVAARAHCAFLLRGLCSEGGAGAAAAAGAIEVRPACEGLQGSAVSRDLGWWLQQLEDSLFAVNELLHQGSEAGLG